MSVFDSRYLGSSVSAPPVETMRPVQQGRKGNGMWGKGVRVARGRGGSWTWRHEGDGDGCLTFMQHCTRTGCWSRQSTRARRLINIWLNMMSSGGRLTAMVLSRGCQLACRIFLLKSRVSSAMFSRMPPGRSPFFIPGLLPGSGPPIFFALKADLSACSTTSPRVSVSNIRK